MDKKPNWNGAQRPNNAQQRPAAQPKNDAKGNKKEGNAINEQIRAKEVRLVGDNV